MATVSDRINEASTEDQVKALVLEIPYFMKEMSAEEYYGSYVFLVDKEKDGRGVSAILEGAGTSAGDYLEALRENIPETVGKGGKAVNTTYLAFTMALAGNENLDRGEIDVPAWGEWKKLNEADLKRNRAKAEDTARDKDDLSMEERAYREALGSDSWTRLKSSLTRK